nr:hypothetical protein Q903MT_gene3056 [Picea sitchensis]
MDNSLYQAGRQRFTLPINHTETEKEISLHRPREPSLPLPGNEEGGTLHRQADRQSLSCLPASPSTAPSHVTATDSKAERVPREGTYLLDGWTG